MSEVGGAGEQQRVSFSLHTDELAFYGRNMERVTEPGLFHAWIGGSCEAQLQAGFELVDESPRG